MQATTTASTTETSVLRPACIAIMASASTIPTSGITATDGTTHGMIPGTAGMLPTIATAITAGTTGAGVGITTDGTLLITMEATTEAIILITMADTQLVVRAQPVTISDHAIAPTAVVQEAVE